MKRMLNKDDLIEALKRAYESTASLDDDKTLGFFQVAAEHFANIFWIHSHSLFIEDLEYITGKKY